MLREAKHHTQPRVIIPLAQLMQTMTACSRLGKRWLLLLLAVFYVGVTYAQTPEKPAKGWVKKCRPKLAKDHDSLRGPFHFEPGEEYRNPPTFSFSVEADGTIHDVKLTHSSGVKDIDQQALKDISKWKFTSRPGCPTIESIVTILIHWR
jgi:TonB family protein